MTLGEKIYKLRNERNLTQEQLGEKLHIYEEPEIVGALGAALYGLEELG